MYNIKYDKISDEKLLLTLLRIRDDKDLLVSESAVKSPNSVVFPVVSIVTYTIVLTVLESSLPPEVTARVGEDAVEH